MSVSLMERKKTKELGWLSKKLRSVLMKVAPESSISPNDLFNSGYGEFAALACQICFFVTFIYYSVVNSRSNLSQRYLAPVIGNGESGGKFCENVALEISNQFIIDSSGNWDSQKSFQFGDTAYRLEMNGVKFSSGNTSYTSQIRNFEQDFKNKSSRGADRDFAWNLMFASSYSKASYDNNGVASLYVDADVRSIYDQTVYSAGFANYNQSCIPSNSVFFYDQSRAALVMEITDIPTLNPDAWKPCPALLDPKTDLLFDTSYKKSSKYRLQIDIASATTAIAVNQGLSSTNALTLVKRALDPSYVRSYIDSYYSPMQPIQCIKPSEWLDGGAVWPYEYNDLCFIRAQGMIMFPVTNHNGVIPSGDGAECWMPEQCKCGESVRDAPGTGCNKMDISMSFVFFPNSTSHLEGGPYKRFVRLMIMAHQMNSQSPDVALAGLVYSSVAATTQANLRTASGSFYHKYNLTASGFADTCPLSAGAALLDAFTGLCDTDCAMLSFALISKAANNFGAKLNSGGYLLNNLSCSDAFYHADTFKTMAATPPTETMQKYQVCKDSTLTAIATAISNAFASAGLYTMILMTIVLSLIINSHNTLYPHDELRDASEKEVENTNILAESMEKLIERGDFTNDEKEVLKIDLSSVFVMDAARYIEEKRSIVLKYANKSPEVENYGDVEEDDEVEDEVNEVVVQPVVTAV